MPYIGSISISYRTGPPKPHSVSVSNSNVYHFLRQRVVNGTKVKKTAAIGTIKQNYTCHLFYSPSSDLLHPSVLGEKSCLAYSESIAIITSTESALVSELGNIELEPRTIAIARDQAINRDFRGAT